jgi:hypothetical protein
VCDVTNRSSATSVRNTTCTCCSTGWSDRTRSRPPVRSHVDCAGLATGLDACQLVAPSDVWLSAAYHVVRTWLTSHTRTRCLDTYIAHRRSYDHGVHAQVPPTTYAMCHSTMYWPLAMCRWPCATPLVCMPHDVVMGMYLRCVVGLTSV